MAVPVSDEANPAGWIRSDGSSSNLYQALDDLSASGSDYVLIGQNVSIGYAVGNTSSQIRRAQSFTVGNIVNATSVEFHLKKTGSPSDGLRCLLKSDINGSTLDTSDTISGSNISTIPGYVKFTFSGAASLPAVFYVIIERTGSLDSSNYYTLSFGTPDYPGGSDWVDNTGVWSNNGTDIGCKLYYTYNVDNDYIRSPAAPGGATYTTRLESVRDPNGSSGHILRYRYRKSSATDVINLTVDLLEGVTTIASWVHNGISSSFVLAEQTLTGTQADSITNYSDLLVQFTADAVSTATPTLVADRASANSNSAVTTVDLVLSGLTVGNYLIVRSAADNSGGGGAARSFSLTNQSGTPIGSVTALQHNNDPGSASAGVTCNWAIAPITATSGTVRITYGGSVVQACVAEEWTGISGSSAGNTTGTGVASTNLASITDNIGSGECFYIAEAVEGPSGDTYTQDSDTTNGSWSSLTKVGTTNATADTNMTTYGGYKVVTAAGNQTYNPTINNARDSAAIGVELVKGPAIARAEVSWANLELPFKGPLLLTSIRRLPVKGLLVR